MDAASLPLAGTELTYVVQGGVSKKAPVSALGVGSLMAANNLSELAEDEIEILDQDPIMARDLIIAMLDAYNKKIRAMHSG